jgi:superfamily II DNA/RNA helicase
MLKKIIGAARPKRCLIFASETYRVQRITERLASSGLKCTSIVSRMEKQSRYSAIEHFRQGSVPFLVTTDLAARGLDIPDITHVISLDLPEESNAYVHRAGRTGRAGKNGISVVIADRLELERASRTAVRFGFVFRTKRLEYGHVIEPTVEEFLEHIEKMDADGSNRAHS